MRTKHATHRKLHVLLLVVMLPTVRDAGTPYPNIPSCAFVWAKSSRDGRGDVRKTARPASIVKMCCVPGRRWALLVYQVGTAVPAMVHPTKCSVAKMTVTLTRLSHIVSSLWRLRGVVGVSPEGGSSLEPPLRLGASFLGVPGDATVLQEGRQVLLGGFLYTAFEEGIARHFEVGALALNHGFTEFPMSACRYRGSTGLYMWIRRSYQWVVYDRCLETNWDWL